MPVSIDNKKSQIYFFFLRVILFYYLLSITGGPKRRMEVVGVGVFKKCNSEWRKDLTDLGV